MRYQVPSRNVLVETVVLRVVLDDGISRGKGLVCSKMAVLKDAGMNMGLNRNGAFGKDWTTTRKRVILKTIDTRSKKAYESTLEHGPRGRPL